MRALVKRIRSSRRKGSSTPAEAEAPARDADPGAKGGTAGDQIWTDHRRAVGQPRKRLFQGSPFWAHLKSVIRHNDRLYSRLGDQEKPSEIDEDTVLLMFEEIKLFFQSHLFGEASVLSSRTHDLDSIGQAFAGDAATLEVTTSAGARDLRLPECDVRPETVRYENRTTGCLRNVYVIVNGRDWRDLDHITRTLMTADGQAEPSDPRARAMALLLAFRATFEAMTRKFAQTARDPLCRNPVAFFNYFGQGTCGTSARNFAILCAHAGLESRVRRSAAHTFTEVRLDGRWRILDPSAGGGAFYPSADDEPDLLGAEDLWGIDAAVVDRVKGSLDSLQGTGGRGRSASMRSRERNEIVGTGAGLLAECRKDRPLRTGLDLRPGERVLLGYGKGGPWYTSPGFLGAPSEDRPAMVREFDLVDGADLEHVRARGVVLDGTRAPAHLAVAGPDAAIEIDLDDSYPTLDAMVTVEAAGAAGAPALTVHVDGDEGSSVLPLTMTSGGGAIFRLARALRGAEPGASITLRLGLPEAAIVSSLRVMSMCQVAGCALPRFGPGSNHVQVDHEGAARADAIGLRLCYRPGAPLGALGSLAPTFPGDGASVSGPLAELTWPALFDAGAFPDTHYRVVVSRSLDVREPVASNFERLVDEPRLELDDDDRSFLRPGRRYAWRVGLVSGLRRTPDRWSNVFTFTLE